MNILALNATYQSEGTTSRLTERALAGAASSGAETEMILLKEQDIKYCTNCLTCYKNHDNDIPACVIDDDVTTILEKVRDADGVILSSPVHNGFITGLMVVFFERAVWRLCKPTGQIMGLAGVPEPRLTDKTRASASIVSAGAIPPEMRQYCDLGTPWLKEMAVMMFNGEFIGDVYAGAVFDRELTSEERERVYFLRDLTGAQLGDAYLLGVRMARAIEAGVKPYDPAIAFPNPEEE